MRIIAFKTKKVRVDDDIHFIVDKFLPKLQEKSIVVITSKIVSICEKNVLKDDGNINKKTLVKQEADYYLGDNYPNAYGHIITIKNNILVLSAGIDESNADGNFIFWPKDPCKSARNIWKYLRRKYRVKNIGVIITDSHMTALRWGVQGVGLAFCGFKPLRDYVGKPDIFGRPLQSTKGATLDGLAGAAVLIMGEGNEQTPLAVITDIPFVEFQNQPPTKKELKEMEISRKDDVYGPLLTAVKWSKGKNKTKGIFSD